MTLSSEIVFQHVGWRGRFRQGNTVLDAARQPGSDINSICGGATSITDKMVGDDPGQE